MVYMYVRALATASVNPQLARMNSAGKEGSTRATLVWLSLSALLPLPCLLPQLWTWRKKAKEVGFVWLRFTCSNLLTTFCVHCETTTTEIKPLKRVLCLHFGLLLACEN